MLNRTFAWSVRILLLTAILAPAGAGAAICDDLDDLATGWDAVANALEETAGDEVAELDVPRLERDVNALLDPTEVLAITLIDMGDPVEEELGEDLLDSIAELYDVEGEDLAAYVVDRIDDIVDALDSVVDYCDEVNE